MGSAASREAIRAIRDWAVAGPPSRPAPRSADEFGRLVFNDAVQRIKLPRAVYKALRRTINRGETLDVSVADAVAVAVKDWALEHGATHYTHWFQPHDRHHRREARLPSSRPRPTARPSPSSAARN